MGHTGGLHCEVRYNEVRVPSEILPGDRGQGFVIAQRRLGPGRIFHCMRWLGQAERAFELMCERANSRWAHGSLLSQKGEIQRYVAESAAEIQAATGSMTLDAARGDGRRGHQARVEISLIKFWGARMLHNVIDRAIQVPRRPGGHGRHAAGEDVPGCPLRPDLRRARRSPPDVPSARRLLKDPTSAPWA